METEKIIWTCLSIINTAGIVQRQKKVEHDAQNGINQRSVVLMSESFWR